VALKLVGEISLDGSGFSRGLNRAQSEASKFASSGLGSIKSAIAGAFSVGAIVALTKKTIDYAGHITDLADRLHVGTDYLQQMQYVLKQNGGSVDDLTQVFEKLGAARMAALGGNAAAQGAFQKLGVGMSDLKTKGTSEILDNIAGQFKKLGNNDEIKSAFKQVGGRGAGILVPAFIDGIDEGRAAATASGSVMSEETIGQLDAIGDQFDQLGIRLMANVAPAILAVTNAFTGLIDRLAQGQAGLGEFLGNLFGSASSKEKSDAEKRAKKYTEQQDRKVREGKITQEQADANKKKYLGNAAITSTPLMDGVGQAVQDTRDAQNAAKKASADALAKKIADRKKPETIGAIPTATAAAPKAQLRSMDSLTSVGNFLGANSGASAIEQIAKKQLSAAEKTNTLLEKITSGGDGFGIPGN